MPYRPRFCIGQFNASRLKDKAMKFTDRKLSDRAMIALLEALIVINIDYIQENPASPWLYQSGLYYKRVIPAGQEDDDWADIPTCITLGYFDCEDGVAYRCAELRYRRGEHATPDLFYQEDAQGNWLYHVRVRRANGQLEDPSKKLDRFGFYTKVFRR